MSTGSNDAYPFDRWLKDLCDVIREISDAEYQQRIWIDVEGPEVGSFSEAINKFFDDCNVDLLIATAIEEKRLKQTQIQKLQGLRDALDRYISLQESDDDLEVINDPRWAQIRQQASETLDALSY